MRRNKQQSQQQAAATSRAGQQRASTPSRLLDELLALDRLDHHQLDSTVTVFDWRDCPGKWDQQAGRMGELSSLLARALAEPPPPPTPQPPAATSGSGHSSGSSRTLVDEWEGADHAPLAPGLKILDIRRTKTDRRRLAGPVDEPAGAGEQVRNIQATSGQQIKQNQNQQRQQSGETLSSYESDYDLLLYLGETETEDLVDTERSADYQDQTWRQSICGGASLAPTIDESLSELLLTTTTNTTNGLNPNGGQPLDGAASHSVSPIGRPGVARRQNQASELEAQWRSTSGKQSGDKVRGHQPVGGGGHSPNWSSSLPRAGHLEPGALAPTSYTLNAQTAKHLQAGCQAPSSQFVIDGAPRAAGTNAHQAPEHDDGRPPAGTKFFSIFNRKQPLQRQQTIEPAESATEHHPRQQWASLAGLATGQAAGPLAPAQKQRQQQQREHEDTAELDRLLAEMSQSLDLDSLARYDPAGQAGRNTRAPSSAARPAARNPAAQQVAHDSSILAEYDGASRILEQMISEQLEQTSKLSRSLPPGKLSGASTSSSSQRAPKRDLPTSAAATTTSSSCSSAATTAATMRTHAAPKSHLVHVQVEPREHADQAHARVDRAVLETAGSGAPAQARIITANPVQRRASVSSGSSLTSSSSCSAPPKPPVRDYEDERASLVGGGGLLSPEPVEQVIQVEAAELPSSVSSASEAEEANVAAANKQPARWQHRQVMSKMKRRTLSSMRSMRDKFNDLTSPRRPAGEAQRAPAPSEPSNQPQPPRRSSSIGSNRSANRAEPAQEVLQLVARKSRGREPKRRAAGAGPADGGKTTAAAAPSSSFGWQLRERLSRSKSRFGRLLSQSPQIFRRRAQSTPDEQRRLSASMISAPISKPADERRLYEPGDIARNSELLPDSFESSLERHLMASLEPKSAAVASDEAAKPAAGASQTKSSSSSELSGLDTGNKRPAAGRFELPSLRRPGRASKRRQRGKPVKQSDADSPGRGPRPTSLISLKRLSGTFGRTSSRREPGPADEDLDSLRRVAASSSPHLAHSPAPPAAAAARVPKRRPRRRHKSSVSQPTGSPNSSAPEQLAPERATTDDYFGLVAPARAANESPEAAKPAASVHLRIEMGPRVRPASALASHQKAAAPTDTQKAARPSHRPAERSQSLRVMGAGSAQADEQPARTPDESRPSEQQKAVSFHNLASPGNQRRLLSPVQPNSFRPAAPAVLGDAPSEPAGSRVALREPGPATPVEPRDAASPLEVPEVTGVRASTRSPIRERGAAILDEIRTKYHGIFGPAAGKPAANQPAPPRPPRRTKREPRLAKAAHRSRSLAAGPVAVEENAADPEGRPPLIIEVQAASPPAGDKQAPAGRRLAELAHQLKSSAADFFHQPRGQSHESQEGGRRAASTRQRHSLRNIDEPLRQEDLIHWRPIIQSSRTRGANSASGPQLPRRSNSFHSPKDPSSVRPKDASGQSADSDDSTWESSDSGGGGGGGSRTSATGRTSGDDAARQVALDEDAAQAAKSGAHERQTPVGSQMAAPAGPEMTPAHAARRQPPADDEQEGGAGTQVQPAGRGGETRERDKRAELPAKRVKTSATTAVAIKTLNDEQVAAAAAPATATELTKGLNGRVTRDSNNNNINKDEAKAVCDEQHELAMAKSGRAQKRAQPHGAAMGQRSRGARWPPVTPKGPNERESDAGGADCAVQHRAGVEAGDEKQDKREFRSQEFRFNADLPSPSEALQANMATTKSRVSAHSAASPPRPLERASEGRSLAARPEHEAKLGDTPNRLSVYENVSQTDPLAAGDVGLRPIAAALLANSRLLQAESVKPAGERHAADQEADEWAVGAANGAPAASPPGPAVEQVNAADEEREEKVSAVQPAERRAERRLVPMTSIIHEPEDELMNITSSSAAHSAPQTSQAERSQEASREVTLADLDELLADSNWAPDDEDDDEDSFAVAAASRQLLVNRFERKPAAVGRGARSAEQAQAQEQAHRRTASVRQQAAAFQPAAPTIKHQLAFARPSQGSLVQRLAKSFDQTIREHQQPEVGGKRAASQQQPPPAPVQKRHSLRTLASQELDEPKSDSTWYDAKSVELLDEAEVAELLREFEAEGATAAAARQAGGWQPSSESQTGNEQFVGVAEPASESASGFQDAGQRDHQDDDDPTLNDEASTLNDDDHTEAHELLEDEDESVYTSAAAPDQRHEEEAKVKGKGGGCSRTGSAELVELPPAASPARVAGGGAAHSPRNEAAPAARHTPPVGVECAAARSSNGAAAAAATGATGVACESDSDLALSRPPGHNKTIMTAELNPPPRPPHSSELYCPSEAKSQSADTNSNPSPTNTQTPEDKIEREPRQTAEPESEEKPAGAERQRRAPSSMFSASLSSTESLNNDDLMAFEALNSKSLLRAAKKCSRLYEELEKVLLARARLVGQRQESPAPAAADCATAAATGAGVSARDCEPHDYDLEPGPAPAKEHDEPDEEQWALTDATSDQSSSRGDDQVSLSSASLSSETLPEARHRQNLRKLYNIVNEICTSEENFLATLRLLNEDFRRHLCDSMPAAAGEPQQQQQQQQLLQQAPFECVGALLRHLPQLQALNENLLEELKLARDQWPKTQKISHVLVKIGPFLKHYSSYIRDFEATQTQFHDNMRKHAHFAQLIAGFERRHELACNKLSLQHHLLRPIQRIPQYRLLLQQYLHHLKPDDADYEDTVSALEVVSRVAEHANQSLNEGANFSKLLALQAKIVGKQRDIVQPGRLFVTEGELLKVCRKQIQPRWLVLLSDALLYLKQIQSSDILYLKYELPLDDCQVSSAAEEAAASGTSTAASELEFNIRTTVRSMTLIAKSRQERDHWLTSLRATVAAHVAKRRSFQQQQQQAGAGQRQQQQLELVGRTAPIWTPDSRAAFCQLCTSNFSALFRRHHCRACGRLVCSACSGNRAPLVYLKCRAARVCDQCFEQLKANMHLYYLPSSQLDERDLCRLDEHFKTLLKSQFVKHVIGWSRASGHSSGGGGGQKQHKGKHKLHTRPTDKQK